MTNRRKCRSRRRMAKLFAMASIFLLMQVGETEGNRCKAEQYTVLNGNKFGTCRDCPRCGEGFEPSPPCEDFINQTTVVKCKRCVTGTFSNDYGTEGCKPCAICHPDQVVKKECTLNSNRVCDTKCKSKDMYYQHEVTDDCQKCSRCCGTPTDQQQQECIDKGMPLNKQCNVNTARRCKEPAPTSAHTRNGKDQPSQTSQKDIKTNSHTTAKTFLSKMVVSPTRMNSSRSDGDSKTQLWYILGVLLPVIALFITAGIIICRRRGIVNCACPEVQNINDSSMYEPCSNKDSNSTIASLEMTPTHREDNNGVGGDPQKINQAKSPTHNLSTDKRCLVELYTVKEYQKICLLLQCKPQEIVPVCGDYTDIAKHYSMEYEQVCALKDANGGPAHGLFVYLNAKQPRLTVEEFAVALTTSEINRTDVVEILSNYYYCN